ncbi:PPR10 [Symbiodinium natans]|uniref:PPR10 protein n=1 Tax=Symbiodinium natans TaxID=878477 RepID=A0A812IHH8_9DINO|nr:PPR10 [Symbiodinium natans]
MSIQHGGAGCFFGSRVSARTYNAALSACAAAGKLELALVLMAELQEEELIPNLMTYRYAIQSCEESGQWELALDLVAEMQSVKTEPKQLIFSSVAAACRRAGLEELASSYDWKDVSVS